MVDRVKQGDLNFAAGIREQSIWGLTEAFVFFLEGAGSALFAVSLLSNQSGYLLPAMAIVAAAALLLLSHLGHPSRAWRAALKVGTSWISRGTVSICFFLALGIVYVFAGLDDGGAAREIAKFFLLAACLVIMAYPAFTLSVSSSIPFWNSALMPLTFVFSSLATGLSWFLALQAAAGVVSFHQVAIALAVLLFLVIALASYLIVAKGATAGAAESVRLLFSRNFAWIFMALAFGAGIFIPAILCCFLLAGAVGAPLLLLLAVSRGVGDAALRYAIVKAGVYDAVY